VRIPVYLSFLAALALAGCSLTPVTTTPVTTSASLANPSSETPAAFVQTSARPQTPTDAVIKQATGGAAQTPTQILVSGAPGANGSGDYRIGPLDVVTVSVFQVPDLGGTFPVSASGSIDMPLLGPVPAAGKTTDELKHDLTALLGAKYLQHPSVTVVVSNAISQRITVDGSVNKPGIYPVEGRTTLLQVIALAGGLTDVASTSNILVLHNIGGKRETASFDYKAIRSGTANDPVVAGGDMVVVDASGFKSAMRGLSQAVPILGLVPRL